MLQASRQPGKYKEESESSDSDEWDDEEDPDNMNVPGIVSNLEEDGELFAVLVYIS